MLDRVADAEGQCIQTSIIPAIAVLWKQRCQKQSSLFSSHLLSGHLKVPQKDVNLSSDLDVSDHFYNSLISR